ncbi:glycosyltransferase family 1 protein [Streptococcus thermophilus]|uniref:Alpha-D-glcNAc alpha-1,2-L-rhamnosyltransferase n=1 Tax=Streptococcus thermophilus TaxID=1308 RepID=A0A4Y5FSD3_STRTR|nr:glycosyltransferase family 1 protein [Streptococcus thermophilus]MBW7794931.1 glycosyltransferase family 1 protein [Streptococcus thermophilus]MBW7813078.1 glycosyltransferase family 1 protein [Streptococcus thermophilus]MCT3094478.1 glycosyltransferase family 1 protein [Streptococcus thermophilus]QBS00350.1 alpha-D-glcNAc alpha-1,2-L-rhamnosyltransferase [Streptococcus thermophilus]QBS00371.1 alpha-D-glcNAc alpha-1,2-L-rhamnosyltransferase [Streptococcus thermophilus]
MKDIFIIGSRGLPAQYGGFETFVEKLVSHKVSPAIRYHVACLSDESTGNHFDYKGADCFTVNPPKLGPARVIAYDMMAINYSLKLIKKERIQSPIFYILGNTIGAFIVHFAKKIQSIGGILLVNPDGLEWKRAKWSKPVQSYLKYSEKEMTKYANLIISDNRGIETYIRNTYPWSRTTFITYGTDLSKTTLTAEDSSVRDWYQKWQTQEKEYYLILGRFVPENNYETAIREFMKSSTERDLVIICNHEGNAYFDELRQITGFDKDKRVKFVGTVYDQDLLKYIRNQAFAYIHGHEVGGTNPGLLEALAQTDLNLIYNVDFNHQVAQETALYWNKEDGNLSQLIDSVDGQVSFEDLGNAAKANMKENYTWEKIVGEYEELFLS